MEIVFEGRWKIEFLPEIINVKLTFDYTEKTYDKSLEIGTNSFEQFVKQIKLV